MRKALSKFINTPWYPVAISAYPVLALLAANAGQIRPAAGLRVGPGSGERR